MAAYHQVCGMIHFTSSVGWLLVHRDQLRAQRSVMTMGELCLYLLGWEQNGFVYVFCSSYEVWTTSVAPACCSLSPEPVGFQSEASVNSQVIRTASPAAKPTVTFPAAEHYPLSSTYFPSHWWNFGQTPGMHPLQNHEHITGIGWCQRWLSLKDKTKGLDQKIHI